ncbi:protein kinase domain-containing protein [Jatrophihabitans sp. YIM 134969]
MTSQAPTPPGRPLGPHDPVALGEYALISRLGEGGMGAVYLGRSRAGRMVAVKVIRREFAQIDEFRVRFQRETANAQRVARFCTAEVLDVDAEGEMPYLVTEFVEGETLAEVVADSGPLSAANLERLAVGVAAALTAIHGAGVVHRDLKPGNVMLSPFGPRVIDFGIARASDAAAGLTQIRVGTPAFMAPEQVLGEPLTAALDVFAWGAVVAFAGTGRLPFGGEMPSIFYKIVNEPPDLNGLQDNGFLMPIIERAMSKNPADRPASNELLLSLLGGAGSGASVLGDPEGAVTRAMVGWSPPLDEPATQLPGHSTRTAAVPPPIVASAPPAKPATTAPVADRRDDPQQTPFHPPTAATRLPNWQQPSGPDPYRPPSGHLGWDDRAPAAPPVRRDDDVPPPSWDPGGPPAPDRARGRGRGVLVAVVAAVVVAALVVGGIFLFGGKKDDDKPAADGSSSSGLPSPSTAPTVAVPAALPKSATLPVTSMVIELTDGSDHQITTLGIDGTAGRTLGPGLVNAQPQLSPDRRTIAYTADGVWQLMAVDGSGIRPLLVGAAARLKPCPGQRVAWNPSGSAVALCASGSGGQGLYVVDPVAGTVQDLPSQAKVGDVTWTPDGADIVYWSGDSADGGPLFELAADGASRPRQLTDGVDSQPVFAPNGQHLTFRRKTADGGFDVVGTRADGSASSFYDFTQGSAADDGNPSYKPNQFGGETIVFVSDRDGAPRLYTFDPAGRPPTPVEVPGQSAGAANVSWSTGAVFSA